MYFPTALFLALATMANTFASVQGHGLIEYPPSRNQRCGWDTKPHEVVYGNGGNTPECYPVFDDADGGDFNGGYQFMSVLTHDIGRMGGRTNHVCGFDSETWQGGATPWDRAMDWPTTPMSAGRNEIRWNIFWGPHFSDTEEFRYWITKPGFRFDAGRALSWDDFEEEPFCVLLYSDQDPEANPDITRDVGNTRFSTYCDVPARAGHQVIYGEWGRNRYTYERFHGCIDAQFGDVPVDPTPVDPTPVDPTPVEPTPAPTPNPTPAPPPALANCNVSVRPGANSWYAGLDIGFDTPSVRLDFSQTGLDLSQLGIDSGNFQAVVEGQTLVLTAPGWVSSSATGYLGFNGANVPALANFADPVCTAARRMLRKGSSA